MVDQRLIALLGKDKKYVVYLVLCNLMTTVSNIVTTLSLCVLVNELVCGVTAARPYVLAFLCAALGIALRLAFTLLNGRFTAVLGTNAKEMLRRSIYEKTARLGVRETAELSLASLTQVGVEGVEQLDLYYSTYLPQLFSSLLSPLVLFLLLMHVCVPSAVILLCCVPLIPMSIIAVSRYAKKIFAKYWGQYTKMGDAFLDNISGMKELKIFGADGMYHEKMSVEAEEFRKITMKVLTMQLASTTIMDLVAYGGAGLGIGIAVLCRMGIHPLFGLSAPALLLFIVLVAVDFFLPMRALGSAFHVSMNGATAGHKILTLLDTPEPQWGSDTPDGCDVSLKSVSFSYVPDRPILRSVSLDAHPGELVGIVGVSGSGKSTVLSLLAGLRQGYDGEILVGGKELHTLSREAYYRCFGLISYNTYLFNDTVRANFRMAKPDITDEEIMARLRDVRLDDLLTPDLVLKEESVNLSGGQRQRLALAVNLASDKPIYCFDEVTSNIDAESEEIILDNIYALSRRKTILMVSHRLRSFERADRIYVLDGGTVAECGSHAALMERGGLYARLYRSQKDMEEGYLK